MGFFSWLFGKKKDERDYEGSKIHPEQGYSYNKSQDGGRKTGSGRRLRNAEEFFAFVDKHFENYEMKKNAPVELINHDYEGEEVRPYDRIIYTDGLPVVVMYTPHNRDHNRAFINAKEACSKAGIRFINFYAHFDNEEGYVADRISAAIIESEKD